MPNMVIYCKVFGNDFSAIFLFLVHNVDNVLLNGAISENRRLSRRLTCQLCDTHRSNSCCNDLAPVHS